MCVVCSHVVVLGFSVRLVPYVVGAVTEMRLVLDVSMLREYGNARLMAMLLCDTGEVWLW